jgi:hypothetical protein
LVVAGGVAAIIGSGGGGGDGDGDNGGPAPAPTTVSYTIGAPQTALDQTEMTLAFDGSHTLTFKKGPDGATELPRTTGSFDILSGAMTADTGSKLWLDLPQVVQSAKISVAVTEKLEWLLGDEPSVGALTIAPRSDDMSGLTGTIRLRFKVDCAGTIQPFRVEWDSDNNGTFEEATCYSGEAFPDLWGGAGPLYARVASGAYLGWSSLYTGFQFTLEAMRRVENSYDAIAQLPSESANPVTVSCNLYPPAQVAGSYGLNWHDWNNSGAFNSGDMVRMTAGDCWINDPGDTEDPRINGTLELRNYARNERAAPTFVGMSLTLTLENPPGTFTDQGAVVLNGGFTLIAPGIVPTPTSGPIGAFNLTNGNMLAAARIAASSAAFFPSMSQVTLAVVERLRAGGVPPFDLNAICQNAPNGTATLSWADLGSPGLSAGDSASLGLGSCDLDGTLTTGAVVYDFTDVTPISASAEVTLQGLTTISTTKSGGYSGKMSVEAIVNAGTRSVEHRPGAANGVITATVSGQSAWQLGCFDVIFRDGGPGTAYNLVNPGVLKTSNKILSIAGGGSLFLQFQLGTPDVLNEGGFTLVSISLPECAALGVPNGVGDSDGNYVTVRGDSPNDNVDDLLMTLFDKNNAVLGTAPTSWGALVQ